MAALVNSFFPLFAILAFVAVVLLVEGLYLMWDSYKGPEAKRIEQRLRALSASADATTQAVVLKNRMLSSAPAIERLLLEIPRVHTLDRVLVQSGLDWTVAKLLLMALACAVTAYAGLAFISVQPLVHLAVAACAAILPVAYVHGKRRRRLRKVEAQLPDALDLLTRAIRAGHALPSALQMAGHEMMDPIAGEFRITHDQVNFGVSMQQALTNLTERVPITDIRYFVVAVLVQREAGGDLTELLQNLSHLIRSRLKFQGRVKVLTTEGRMSAWVLAILPFALAGVLNITNPEFVRILWTDPVGIAITNVVLTMMLIGALWLYKLVKVRV